MSELFSSLSVQESSSDKIISIGKLLKARAWHISCAESCTGGGLAYYFTSVAGSSEWFRQSWVTYSNEAKQRLLGVTSQTLNQFGAVSEQTVKEMAAGCAQNAQAHVGIAVSGIAGPGGGSVEKPVGTVWFGFWIAGETIQLHRVFSGDRNAVRNQAIAFCIGYLHQWLVDHPH
ncbi:nicotinamide-nucleotide amidohydrolase family protein [Alteromonas ponticola]|uniref:Nicotinamide-nucleotide amidohydrolase family protein n=1 Tax=Alteromonas aquimaris TaxID=2998417 RepID=A0ABT3P2G8_9ALTE|nr:nicotinamide-nucleotide amidohydrolase family protein [Alteromonas aquimaris]MCW8106952.1 nicotinamide-nucleotide amidohydrolase family protein [Alteromonas aquimaris]